VASRAVAVVVVVEEEVVAEIETGLPVVRHIVQTVVE
jgi:hypothetical protein